MTKATNKQAEQKLIDELNLLDSFKKMATDPDGVRVMDFIIKETEIHKDPFSKAKNSGETANTLGKQTVGRKILDKFIEAGVKIDYSAFSNKSSNRIEELKKEIGGVFNARTK